MMNKCSLRISRDDYNILVNHLFPGDNDEHGAVLLAGMSQTGSKFTLYVREVYLAQEGTDYIEGKVGYRALTPKFIHKLITRARDERLVYLAVHNHESDQSVAFSNVDLESHELGYPALLQIVRGMPVGALVLGRRSIQADIWLPEGVRLELDSAVVIGNTIQRLTPSPIKKKLDSADKYDRQIKMFGKMGQAELANCQVGIIGLGGIGSLLAEYLARLGIVKYFLVDDDKLEVSNLSRVVASSLSDAIGKIDKVEIARRNILQANTQACIQTITDDVAKESVAKQLIGCDYIFLAADSMRAKLVFNALVHQYLIPGVQLGSKIRADSSGGIVDAMSVNRPVRPGHGCLWCNQFIDTNLLAKEAKTDEERKAQEYGVEEANPSVISLNAISAAHAVNDFMLNYLSIRPETGKYYYEHFHHLKDPINVRSVVQPRRDNDCSECSHTGLRYGRGDLVSLPCIEG